MAGEVYHTIRINSTLNLYSEEWAADQVVSIMIPTALVFDYTSEASLLFADIKSPQAFDLGYRFREVSLGK